MEKNDECREWIDPRRRMYRLGNEKTTFFIRVRPVQYCFHVICMCQIVERDRRHRQISGRFPMSHVDLGLFSEGGLRSHVDLGTIGLTGPRSQDDMGQNPRLTQHCTTGDVSCPMSCLLWPRLPRRQSKAIILHWKKSIGAVSDLPCEKET